MEATGTTVVEPGWRAEVNPLGHLLLSRSEARAHRVAIGTSVDPVMLEIFNNLFMSIAEQMGSTLENTSYSVNMKERRDYSCAVFDTGGVMVAQAAHIPVHLGAMTASVRAGLDRLTLGPGDVAILNDPYLGGTHLPDVSLMAPVYVDSGDAPVLAGYVANRGHHADIGGMSPGSLLSSPPTMPGS